MIIKSTKILFERQNALFMPVKLVPGWNNKISCIGVVQYHVGSVIL